MENCPNCNTPLKMSVRKEKYKSKTGIKLAVNLNVYECDTCEDFFIDEEEERIYKARCTNYMQKVENSMVKH